MMPQEGTVFRVWNGMGSGNFSWLIWNTIYPPFDIAKLTASLTWTGNIDDYPENGYYEPFDRSDMSLDINDWVEGHAGNVNSNSVRDALNDLIVQERVLRLPVWSVMNGTGSSSQFRMSSFGLFRLHGYNVVGAADSWLLLEFVGWDNYCEQVVIAGVTTGVQDTAYSFTASVSPMTVTLPLTYRWEATGQTAVTHISSTLTDTISYSWSVAGTKTVTVTVNDGMETAVVSTHTIQIDVLPPTPTPTPTWGPSPTSAPTLTPSPCDIEFEGHALAGNRYVWINGTAGVEVTIHDLTSGTLLGTDILLDRPDHACSGFADFMDNGGTGLLPPLITGHIIAATGDDGTSDTIVVLNEPPTSTPTPTPHAPDLVVVGAPKLISIPPIVAYQPVSFTVMISNTGNMPVNNLFFIDLYFDPDPPVVSTTIRIPISQSDGYTALSSLAEQTSRVITITSPAGFQNEPSTHLVYAMVDSLEGIYETDETNNISAAAILDDVEPANTPTPTPLPTPLPCDVEFEGTVTAGDRYVWITGDIGVTVELYDLTTSILLGTDVMVPRPYHACPGFADFTDSSGVGMLAPLIEGHVIVVMGDDGTEDSAVVLALPPTSTPTSTPTPSDFTYLPIIWR